MQRNTAPLRAHINPTAQRAATKIEETPRDYAQTHPEPLGNVSALLSFMKYSNFLKDATLLICLFGDLKPIVWLKYS